MEQGLNRRHVGGRWEMGKVEGGESAFLAFLVQCELPPPDRGASSQAGGCWAPAVPMLLFDGSRP